MYYHVTSRDRVNSILRNGLLPNKESMSSNKVFDWKVDSSFIYLWHEQSMMIDNMIMLVPDPVVLKVNIPDNITVERDQDMLRMMRLLGDDEAADNIVALSNEEYNQFMGSYQVGEIPAAWIDLAFKYVEQCQYANELAAYLKEECL